MDWQYKHEDPVYDEIPAGMHRLRIREANKKVSKSGNDMLELKFDVSGHTSWLFYYITFLVDRPEITNRMLTSFFDSFGIHEGDFNMQGWIGKVGAAQVKMDDQGRPKIQYLISRKKQDDLPAWREPGNKSPEAGGGAFTPVEEPEDLPF